MSVKFEIENINVSKLVKGAFRFIWIESLFNEDVWVTGKFDVISYSMLTEGSDKTMSTTLSLVNDNNSDAVSKVILTNVGGPG